ncbi:hypothetical protein SAMN06265365_1584 [Tistlia consotensis]|uniref:Uncharacterized protein n=1 Tax=Tistlia consotensis USBA 355 TaxID=560819 RepID=A0A1Y6CSP6_9PROT|nr:hypothetical protein [Tistlia consotensis]SMF85800.1 hypothetical protein SAMN05428998_1724 [Tistlia consotensis USBA 355]SNS37868.1 hypothetical protein SAMN06265365_1584 [Tistlia consotensis]
MTTTSPGPKPDYGDAWLQHLRIAVLRSLGDCKGQTGHESLLTDMVNAVHIMADRDQVREQLAWLHEQELVIAEVSRGALVATLTEAGQWVAEGKRTHPGVKRPNVTAAVARQALSIALDQLKR